MEKNQLMSAIQMDAKVTLDDLVNIHVSRYEEAAHQKRHRLQQQIKELNASKVALIKTVRAAVLDCLKSDFQDADVGAIKISFTFEVAEEGDLSKDIFWNVDVHQFTDIANKDDMSWRAKTSYSPEVAQTVVWVMKHRVEVSLVEEWQKLDKELAALKDQLLLVNADIQSIDRKTRQIKGMLAAKKLEDVGFTDLLEMPEVKDILKLTQG